MGVLSLVFGVLLLSTCHLTRQLIRFSKPVERAGAECMRVDRRAALAQ